MNKVELLGYYGTDLVHAQSAWTSTSRDLSEEKLERVEKLLDMLASEGHHTPFEKSSLHFLVTVDQATHIHLLKHRIGVSINGESARYKELKEDKMYLPNDWNGIEVTTLNDIDTNYFKYYETWKQVLEGYSEMGNRLYHNCLKDLEPVLGRKRAKESARYFKTYNSQIQADVMFNMRSFHNFLTQRMDGHSQLEIREIATEMLNLIKNIEGNPFQHSLAAFGF